jgi:hypothetical protein
MRDQPSAPELVASARLPQLDPHAVWAQGFPGKASERAVAATPANEPRVVDRDVEWSNKNADAETTKMAEPQFAMNSDDDLPRTFRRERDRRTAAASLQASGGSGFVSDSTSDGAPGEGPPVTVTAFDVPFLKMVTFFLKGAFAAIPALIVLGLIMFAMGQIAQTYLPWLVKMRIMIQFPG